MNQIKIRLDKQKEIAEKFKRVMEEKNWSAQKVGEHILIEYFKDKKPVKKAVAKKQFSKPTIEEIQREFHLLGSMTCLDDGEAFYNHYSSNGWKVGKNAMKDWKATVRNWHKRNKEKQDEKNQRNGITSAPTVTLRDNNF